jgi:DNA polymerase-3 subunit alpha
MGTAAVDVIINERHARGHYKSLLDFLERVDLRSVNKKVIEVSIQSGLFDRIESSNRATLLHNMERMIDHVNSIKEQSQFGQVSLFGENQDEITPELRLEEVPPWSNKDILQIEKDNLGFYFSGHPLDEYRPFWNKCTNLKLDQPGRASPDKEYTILGMLKSIRTTMTKRGAKMAFASVEDFNGSIDLVLFSKTFDQYAHLLEEDKVLGFTGQVDLSRSEPSFKVKEIFLPEEMREIQNSEIHIELEEREYLKDELVDFRAFLQDRNGSSSVYLHLKRPENKIVVKVSGQITIAANPSVLQEIGQYPIVSNIWKE